MAARGSAHLFAFFKVLSLATKRHLYRVVVPHLKPAFQTVHCHARNRALSPADAPETHPLRRMPPREQDGWAMLRAKSRSPSHFPGNSQPCSSSATTNGSGPTANPSWPSTASGILRARARAGGGGDLAQRTRILVATAPGVLGLLGDRI